MIMSHQNEEDNIIELCPAYIKGFIAGKKLAERLHPDIGGQDGNNFQHRRDKENVTPIRRTIDKDDGQGQ